MLFCQICNENTKIAKIVFSFWKWKGNHGASGQDQSNVVKQMESGVNVSQDGGGVHKDDKD